MSAAKTCTSPSCHCIDLIDKYNAGGILFCIIKKISYPGCSYSHEHLHEIRAGNGKEGNPRFSRNRFCNKSFSGARRAHQNDALGNTGSGLCILFRIFKEINYLLKILLFFLKSRHILKCDFLIVFIIKTGTASSEVHHLCIDSASLTSAQHENKGYEKHTDNNRNNNP